MSTDKAKNLLAKIKELFTAAEGGVEHKLADGTVLKMDKMEAGGKLTVNNAAVTAAGEYTLADGTKIAYDVAGVITGVTPAPAQATTPTAFTDFKLADGTVISADKLEVGGSVKIGGTPAPAGEYKMEDGGSITVDATGLITAVVPKSQAAAPAPAIDMSTPAGMRAAYDKFANGTIDATGTATILKALMEYCFGWQLREQAAKKVTEDAMAVYQTTLNSTASQLPAVVENQKTQAAMLKQMFELMTEVVGLPTGDPPINGKKKFSFSNVELKSKSLEKYQAAAQKMSEEFAEKLKIA